MAAHQDAALHDRGYASGQHSANGQHPAGGSWYGDAASGYLPTGYNNGGNGNGHAASHNGNGHASYGADHQQPSYQNSDQQVGSATPGYAPPGPFAGHYDQRGYSTPDLGYGQDGYQGYGAAGR